MGTGAKEDESSTGHIWAAGFHQSYGLFSLGVCFETCELFIYLNFKFFW
jgi:hypothetical protein